MQDTSSDGVRGGAPVSAVRRGHALAFLLIIVVAAALRLWDLAGTPLTNDEQSYIACSLAPEEFATWGALRDVNVGSRYEGRQVHPVAKPLVDYFGIYPIFGATFASVRLSSALAGVAGVLLIAGLVRRLTAEDKPALLAAAMLALMPLHVRFSRSAYLDPFYAAAMIAALWATLCAIEERRAWRWLIAGACAGWLASIKLTAPLFLAALATFALWELRRRKAGARSVTAATLLSLAGFCAVFLVLNDPIAYARAGLSPTDSKYTRGLGGFLTATILDGAWWKWLFASLVFLGPVTLIPLALFGWKHAPPAARTLVVVWGVACIPLLALHAPSISGEQGLVPIAIPIIVAAACAPVGSLVRAHVVLAGLLAIVYGMSWVRLPYRAYMNFDRWSDIDYRMLRHLESRVRPGEACLIEGATPSLLRHAVLCIPAPLFSTPADGVLTPERLRAIDAILVADVGGEPVALPGFTAPLHLGSGNASFLFYRSLSLDKPTSVPFTAEPVEGTPGLYRGRLPDWRLAVTAWPELLFDGEPLAIAPPDTPLKARRTYHAPVRKRRLEWTFREDDPAALSRYTVRFAAPHPYRVFQTWEPWAGETREGK